MATVLDDDSTKLQQLNRNNSHDTIIFCRGEEFKVEKAALIASSPYFKHVFINKSNDNDKIYMDSFQPESLTQVFDFIYNNPLQLTDANVQNLMTTARSLEITLLYEKCIAHLESTLNAANFVEIWNIADLFSDNDLRSAVINYCVENYSRLRNKNTFLTLSKHRLQTILQDPNLIGDMEQLLETIVEWIRLGQPEKQQEMTELLYVLRSDIASKHYLQRMNHDKRLLQQTPALRELFRAVLESRQSKPKPIPKNPNTFSASSGEISRKPPSIIAFIENEKQQTIVELRQLNGEIISKTPRLSPFEVRHAGTVVHCDRIYCAGGKGYVTSHQFFAKFSCYDAIADDVYALSSMSIARAQMGLAVHEGHIYSVGGYNNVSELVDVEKYSIDDDTWSVVTSLSKSRRGVACVSFAGRLYAVGGRRNMETLISVEYYTSESDQWTTVAPLLYPRSNCVVSFVNGKMYACGGFWSIRELIKSNVGNVQVYDCGQDCWSIGTSLKTTSLITSAFSWNDKLYIFNAAGIVLVYYPLEGLVERVRQVTFSNGLVRCVFPVSNRSGLRGVHSFFSMESVWSLSSSSRNDDVFEMEETKL
uniref:Kelch-like protein diablo n=1 Tax=Strigamia maritima TaxID=126957 RepID=T1IMF3_STRMM